MSKRLALTLLLFLGEIAHAQTLATAARQPDQPIGSNQPAAQQLSPQQNEVWKGEQNYFRYLQAKDLKGFMSIGDDNFLGWPDYSEMP